MGKKRTRLFSPCLFLESFFRTKNDFLSITPHNVCNNMLKRSKPKFPKKPKKKIKKNGKKKVMIQTGHFSFFFFLIHFIHSKLSSLKSCFAYSMQEVSRKFPQQRETKFIYFRRIACTVPSTNGIFFRTISAFRSTGP